MTEILETDTHSYFGMVTFDDGSHFYPDVRTWGASTTSARRNTGRQGRRDESRDFNPPNTNPDEDIRWKKYGSSTHATASP